MCEPHFREFSPPEQCKAALLSGNHWVCSNINLLHINSGLSLRFLFYVCLLINHEQKWVSSLSKTASRRTTFSFCNFSVRENGFFSATLLFATDSYISNLMWFQIAQILYVFFTGHKSPKPLKVYVFKYALKTYWPWGFKVFQRTNNAEEH